MSKFSFLLKCVILVYVVLVIAFVDFFEFHLKRGSGVVAPNPEIPNPQKVHPAFSGNPIILVPKEEPAVSELISRREKVQFVLLATSVDECIHWYDRHSFFFNRNFHLVCNVCKRETTKENEIFAIDRTCDYFTLDIKMKTILSKLNPTGLWFKTDYDTTINIPALKDIILKLESNNRPSCVGHVWHVHPTEYLSGPLYGFNYFFDLSGVGPEDAVITTSGLPYCELLFDLQGRIFGKGYPWARAHKAKYVALHGDSPPVDFGLSINASPLKPVELIPKKLLANRSVPQKSPSHEAVQDITSLLGRSKRCGKNTFSSTFFEERADIHFFLAEARSNLSSIDNGVISCILTNSVILIKRFPCLTETRDCPGNYDFRVLLAHIFAENLHFLFIIP